MSNSGLLQMMSAASVLAGVDNFVSLCSATGSQDGMISLDNGETWAQLDAPSPRNYVRLLYGGGTYCGAPNQASSAVSVSPTGLDGTWTTNNFSVALGGTTARGLAYGNSLWVMSVDGSPDDVVGTSPDTVTWTPRAIPFTGTGNIVLGFGDYMGGRFVGLKSGTTGAGMYCSDPTSTWTQVDLPFSASWAAPAFGDDVFVTVRIVTGDDLGMRSLDGGATWSTFALPAIQDWNAITYAEGFGSGAGRFVAVASSGTNRVAYSDDNGATWTPVAVPDGSWSDVDFGGGILVAVGGSTGTYNVMVSEDGGETWVAGTTPADTSYSVVSHKPNS